MSDESKDAPELDTCGCCEGLSVETPAAIANPPGLDAIRYRSGTHATFKSSMLARLVTAQLEPDPLLGPPPNPAPAPDVRAADDFSAALIDAFAVAADVLTFYQERIANESYLRTATERRSVLELAREIGYELKPGVAASTPLELFTDDPPAAATISPAVTLAAPLREVPIATGTKVQSVPGPGETAQTFETVEDVTALPEWNAIKPKLWDPNWVPTNVLYATGKVDVKPGDVIVVEATGQVPAVVTLVDYQQDVDRTRIVFAADSPIPGLGPPAIMPLTLDQLTSQPRSLDDGMVQLSFVMARWETTDLQLIARLQQWNVDDLERTMTASGDAFLKANTSFYTFAVRAGIFGNQLPATTFIRNPNAADIERPFVQATWPDAMLDGGGPHITRVLLDGIYKDIGAPSLAVLWKPSASVRAIYNVTKAAIEAQNSPTLNARVSALDVSVGAQFPPPNEAAFTVHTTTVLAQSTRFAAPDLPDDTVIAGHGPILLDGVFTRMKPGQKLAISGARADAAAMTVREVVVLKTVAIIEARFTEVTFENDLRYRYVRKTVTFNANVAASTHGETVEELLGSGDASVPYQSFHLRQKPLTYVHDPASPGGVRSTLEIRVNDVLWQEVPALYGHGPRERIYVTRRLDDGTIIVQFGDGLAGARVPTGNANVRAKYRKGIGLDGLVGRDKLTLLLSRPLGLNRTTNPLPAADAADPEPRDEARTNAPLTVLTLDRIASLRDYEDYARGYSGVAKALATSVPGTERRGIFVTVAGPGGRPITETDSIETALHTFGSPFVPLRVRSIAPVYFRVAGPVKVLPDRDPAIVKNAIEAKLRQHFAFERRAFGQPVHSSEVTALIQSVDGVLSAGPLTYERNGVATTPPLVAAIPQGNLTPSATGAELLLLDPRPVNLTVTK